MLLRIIVLTGLLISVFAGSASAESLVVRMESEHPNSVAVMFYSTSRDHIWPDNKDVFLIDDDGVHTYPLQCKTGEQICYGAWVRGDEKSFWGVGPDNKQECTDCCFQCEGGETNIISLTQ